MVPWLASVPSIFLGRAISEKLIKTGYSITATRKIIQTTCFVIQAVNLLFLGLLIISLENYHVKYLCIKM